MSDKSHKSQAAAADQTLRKMPDNHRPMAWVLVQKYGVLGTIRLLWSDVAWDLFNRVDTAKPVSNKVLFDPLDAIEQNRYVASTFSAVNSALAYLQPHVNFSKCNFVDIGSGKGKALIAASRYPFLHLKGLEVSSVLNDIAVRNVNTLGLRSKVSAIHGNAAQVEVHEDDVVFYFFNPFTGAVLNSCLRKIADATAHRKGFIIYVNPTEDAIYQQYFKLMGKQVFQPGDVEVNFYETR